jgi:uncharacterized protein YhbP (UPF0306 family)
MNEKLSGLLQRGVTIQLATSANNQPWVATLYYVADGIKLYWVSATKRRHSKEIEQNNKVSAAVVVESDPNGHRLGVQLSGSAERVLERNELEHAAKLYVDKYDSGDEYYTTISVLNEDQAIYKMKIDTVAIFDSEHTPTIELLTYSNDG